MGSLYSISINDTVEFTHRYHILSKRQMIKLHDDTGIIIMTNGILVKMNSEIEIRY